MSHTDKALLLTVAGLTALIVGITAGILARIDGATLATTITAGGIGFASTLTLILACITTYTLL
ncbi:hypothetical protein [Nocardia anaemiae]|uniref:hypothetical protein n=1 Tax=Nocardia anaemiae TaxID=263910 RepID=UPI0007A3FD48|nr:hypothetical protein [Nocardia anaemiae]